MLTHSKDRVQSGHGVLKDHGYLGAPDLTHISLAGLEQVFPFKKDLTVDHLSWRIGHQTHDGQGGGGLTGPGFTHQSQRLSLFQTEANTVDGLDRILTGGIMNGQIFNI